MRARSASGFPHIDALTVMIGAAEPEEVIVERRGRLGTIRLNRPRALNALTRAMVRNIAGALEEWRRDDAVQAVLVSGEGERGLCAGGDIVALHRHAVSRDVVGAAAFWTDEYRLNALVAAYPKPYIAFMDGLVLGGGVGISAHGSHRVVTETSAVGLPETRIGFVPDVGGTWLLSRAPGETGTYAALTAETVGAGDAIAMGLADVYVPRSRLAALALALEGEAPDAALRAHAEPPPDAPIVAGRSWIDPAFSAEEVEEVIARLEATPGDAPARAAAVIRRNSPSALAAALEALRRARELSDLSAVLRQEYRVSLRGLLEHDFAEGVRARLVEKDRDPQWAPTGPVPRAAVASWFDPPKLGDLVLDAAP